MTHPSSFRADYVDPTDFPAGWPSLDITVDVEAKAKERAVPAIMAQVTPPPD